MLKRSRGIGLKEGERRLRGAATFRHVGVADARIKVFGTATTTDCLGGIGKQKAEKGN